MHMADSRVEGRALLFERVAHRGVLGTMARSCVYNGGRLRYQVGCTVGRGVRDCSEGTELGAPPEIDG